MSKILFTAHDITTTFVGRNGTGKCIGLHVANRLNVRGDVSAVTISPINSKGLVANCSIDIPFDDIESLVVSLREIQKNAYTKNMKAGESLIKLGSNVLHIPIAPKGTWEYKAYASLADYENRLSFLGGTGFVGKNAAKTEAALDLAHCERNAIVKLQSIDQEEIEVLYYECSATQSCWFNDYENKANQMDK